MKLELELRYIDLMFLGKNEFMYEPNYNHWKSFNEPDY